MGMANIPTDWTGDYIDFVVRWPKSDQWEAILRGQLSNPAFEEFWDLYSGNPDASRAAMDDTFDTNLDLQEGAIMKAGFLMDYAGSVIPSGWLVCDGSEVSRTTYARLFTAIGTIYGVGDGSTTFNLPPAAGRVNVALDVTDADFNALGEFRGQKNVTLELTEIPSHNHTQNSHGHTQPSHNHTQNSHVHTQSAHNHTQDAHNHGQQIHDHTVFGNVAAASGTVRHALDTGSGAGNKQTTGTIAANNPTTATNQSSGASIQATTPTNNATTATNDATTATNQASGGGLSHNNIQPSIVFYRLIKD